MAKHATITRMRWHQVSKDAARRLLCQRGSASDGQSPAMSQERSCETANSEASHLHRRRKHRSRRARPACGPVACVGVSLASQSASRAALPGLLVALLGRVERVQGCPVCRRGQCSASQVASALSLSCLRLAHRRRYRGEPLRRQRNGYGRRGARCKGATPLLSMTLGSAPAAMRHPMSLLAHLDSKQVSQGPELAYVRISLAVRQLSGLTDQLCSV